MPGSKKKPIEPKTIFLVSDGSGRTCTQLVKSVLVQFDPNLFQLELKAGVRTTKKAQKVVAEAAELDAAIFHTLVSQVPKKALKEAAHEAMVPTVDVIGPVVSALNSLTHHVARTTPGLFYKSEREYFDRIDSIDFTLKHDDGRRLQGLNRADVVLVGVSRVSKSSTCFFLAYRGIRAANVPLLAGQPVPPELFRLDPDKVIGLTVNPSRLQSVRRARLHAMGVNNLSEYTGRDAVLDELHAARDLMIKHGWRRIDVSYKAIEEVARDVMRLLDDSRKAKARAKVKAAKPTTTKKRVVKKRRKKTSTRRKF